MLHDRIIEELGIHGLHPAVYYLKEQDACHQELFDTAVDFSKAGVLKLPHECTIFVIETFQQNSEVTKLILVCQEDLTQETVEINILKVHKKEGLGLVPIKMFYTYKTENREYVPLTNEFDFETEEIQQELSNVTAGMLQCMMLLNTKYIVEKIKKVGHTTNSKRKRKNKKRLHGYSIINLKKYQYNKDSTSGERKSPKLHWRMGHLRRNPNGKIIRIDPMVIGVKGGNPNKINKVYKVRK